MYYVWESNLSLVDRFAFFKEDPPGLDMDLLRTGVKITPDLPICDIVTNESYPTALSDLLLTDYPVHIVSPKLIQIINDLSIVNVQLFPVSIKNHETGETNETYKILNVIGAINCVDLDNSEYAKSRRSGNLIELSKYQLLEDNIKAFSGGEKPLIFRLGEFDWHLLVHEKFKQALEAGGMTGCAFIPTEEYA